MRSDLNAEQQRAVETIEGPLLIIAGPGTGKTKTLTERIVHLLQQHKAKPEQILALTFTNKAAKEMQDRVRPLLQGSLMPHITTFHALCNRLLAEHRQAEITFIDEAERLLLIKDLRKVAAFKTLTTRELALTISRLKNMPPDLAKTVLAKESALAKLLAAYNHALKARGVCDFDDLLLETHELLGKGHATTEYRYVLVDEFQDTNVLQYELLQLLRTNDNVCVIGDPLQSIYGFRGAGANVFERFAQDYPQAKHVTLTINYRSVPEVVQLANAIFPKGPQLQAYTTAHGRVRAIDVLDEHGEAAWVVRRIEQGVGGTDFLQSHTVNQHENHVRTFRDFVILYRTHFVSRTMRHVLADSGIPYQIVGDESPYEQPDAWAIIQMLRYVDEPTEEHATALHRLPMVKSFSVQARQALFRELEQYEKLSEMVAHIAEAFGLSSDKLNQFTSTIIRFDTDLPGYLRYVDAIRESEFYDSSADAVTLMTIHAAKGLEFNHVFLLAAEEGILPLIRSNGAFDEAEERRLFYVAATRAREQLDILHARNRLKEPARLSSFITDVPTATLAQTSDETIADQQRRREKRRQKTRQRTLFDL